MDNPVSDVNDLPKRHLTWVKTKISNMITNEVQNMSRPEFDNWDSTIISKKLYPDLLTREKYSNDFELDVGNEFAEMTKDSIDKLVNKVKLARYEKSRPTTEVTYLGSLEYACDNCGATFTRGENERSKYFIYRCQECDLKIDWNRLN